MTLGNHPSRVPYRRIEGAPEVPFGRERVPSLSVVMGARSGRVTEAPDRQLGVATTREADPPSRGW